MDLSVAKKLRLSSGMKVLILNSPEGYFDSITQISGPVMIDPQPGGNFDFVQLFVRNRQELDQFVDQAIQSVKYDGLLWISYPKGSSKVKTDLNRDKIWRALSDTGIRPVSLISIDEVWSAMRFRPVEAVGGN